MNNLTENGLRWFYDLAVLAPREFVELETELQKSAGYGFIEARKTAMEELSLVRLCIDIDVNAGRYTFN